MRLLLTGAQGFTGIHLSHAAKNAGYEVVSLASDLLDEVAIREELARLMPNAVIHLAGISHIAQNLDLKYYEVNLVGSLNLLKGLAALNRAPQKVILASSANVYGNNTNSPISETEPPSPVSHYAMSKLAMEYLSRPFLERLPIIVTRPFNYTGVGHDPYFVIPKIIDHIQRGATTIELGNLDVLREYNDVRDVCQIYLQLLRKGDSGSTYNIASGRTHSLQEVLDTLEQLSGQKMNVLVNPQFIRAHEIQKLCGDNTLLQNTIGPIGFYPLEDTLRWMLNSLVIPKVH